MADGSTMRVVLSPDRPNRRVLCALEVVDPLTLALVWRGVRVTAEGLANPPIVNASGRFVWLREDNAWPTRISVATNRLPFEDDSVTKPRPADLDRATAADRLFRVVLRPTAAYDLPEGVTAIRGRLVETSAAGAAPVTDARVQLAWFDLHANAWVPAPPASVRDAGTSAAGDFATLLRLSPASLQEPDITKGHLKVRLHVTRNPWNPETRATPDAYPFVSDPLQRGRVVEGLLLDRDLTLAWADLVPA
jgi:hypothetical protein